MTLRQLEYFVATVDAGSISRAALELHVAQPSLSVRPALVQAIRDGAAQLGIGTRPLEWPRGAAAVGAV